MKTRALLVTVPVLALAFAVASCTAQNRASVQIQALCVPSDDCKFKDTCDLQYLGYTRLDTSVADRVMVFVQVANQLSDNSDDRSGRLNTHDAHVDGAKVSYDGAPLATDTFSLPIQRIAAGGTSVVMVEPIRSQSAAALATIVAAGKRTIVANVRLRGYYDDGSRFETGEFPIATEVCAGCLPAAACPVGKAPCPLDGMEPVACGTTQ